jgi:hypothetical protein
VKPYIQAVLIFLAVCLAQRVTRADGKSQLAKEVAEVVMQRFGKQAVREGTVALARRIEALAVRHGSEVFQALKKVGPRAFHLVEEAGAHGKDAVRLLAMHGEQGAAWVLSRPAGMALFLKHGDKAATALCKHPGIAEPIIGRFGAQAVHALDATGAQGGRRLAMLVEGGELAKIGRTQEVLEVIAKYGDRAITYVWEKKGALAVGAGLTAFLAQPEIFINGAKDVAGIVGENVVRPVMQIPGAVASEVARGTNWTLIFLAAGAAVFLWLAVKYLPLSNKLRAAPQTLREVNPVNVTHSKQNNKACAGEKPLDQPASPRIWHH